MKTIAALCILTTALGLVGQEPAARQLDSRIRAVTVYPEWAFVTRAGRVQAPAGRLRVTLPDLPAWIVDDSLRVSAEPAGAAKIIAARAETIYLSQSTKAEVNAARAELQAIQDRQQDLQAQLELAAADLERVRRLVPWLEAKLPADLATRGVDAEELGALHDFVGAATRTATQHRLEIQRELRDVQPELTAAQKRYAELGQRSRMEKKQVVVELEVAAPAAFELSVGYLISGASWFPAYAARTDAARQQIELSCEAVVQQNTGEDWQDAAFTLSTIQPERTQTKPELEPWYIGSAKQAANAPGQFSFRGSAGKAKYADIQEQQIDFNVDNEAFQQAQANIAQNRALMNEVVKQAEERGTTVEFQIEGRHGVLTDGRPVRMPIGEAKLAASPVYTAVPAVSKSTYVTGGMRNQAEFPFLPGPVRIFVAGSFIGQTRMDFVAAGEKLELYLGLEERLKVTRELDGRKSSTAFLSKRQRLTASYRIAVRNFLDGKAVVIVRDQVPVSQTEAITVKLDDVKPRAESVEKGIITWRLELAAGKAEELEYEFEIEYPPDVPTPDSVETIQRQILRK